MYCAAVGVVELAALARLLCERSRSRDGDALAVASLVALSSPLGLFLLGRVSIESC